MDIPPSLEVLEDHPREPSMLEITAFACFAFPACRSLGLFTVALCHYLGVARLRMYLLFSCFSCWRYFGPAIRG